jgi:ABC-2 type transport system ATP-binding protein
MLGTTSAIRCRGLRKVYEGKVEAVRGLDLEVRSGEFFGLLGPNGAGKTTTIEILEGLLAPSEGEVEVLGACWGSRDEELRQRIGISLQETRLAEKLTVLETLRLFRSFYRRGIEPAEVLAQVGLSERPGAMVGKLSGGQRQRLAVACALVGDPDLLFLDEPTTGLDPHSRRQLWDILLDFRSRGRTILLTTHYMDEAERLCDRVAIVDSGRVIALGSPQELIAGLGGEHVVEFAVSRDGEAGDAAVDRSALEALPGVRSAGVKGRGFHLTVTEPHLAIPTLLEWLRSENLALSRLTTHHASLEDVFVSLTGRRLAEGEGTGEENGKKDEVPSP